MNFSATDDPTDRDIVVLRIVAALASDSHWVRIGAALALAREYPTEGREALRRRWGEAAPLSDEQFAMTLALEISGDDTFPLLAPLLGVTSSDAWPTSHDAWASFLNDRRSYLSKGARNLLFELQRVRRLRLNSRVDATVEDSQPDKYEMTASRLDNLLEHMAIWNSGGAFRVTSSRIFDPIITSLKSKDAARAQAAVVRLVEVALSELSGWHRDASIMVLSNLGAEAGNRLLLSLWGESHVFPDAQMVEQLVADADADAFLTPDEEELNVGIGPQLGAYFAGQALARFTDEETIVAIVGAAAKGAGRAEAVLGNMSIDVSLPALLWAAVNHIEWDERHRASLIIQKIIAKHPDYAIHYHRVAEQFVDVDLQWIGGLVVRNASASRWTTDVDDRSALSWLRNKTATTLVVKSALLAEVTRQGEISISYRDLPVWDRFVNYVQRIGNILRGKDKKLPSTIDRYMDCRFPSECVRGMPTRLSVSLEIDQRSDERNPLVKLDLGSNDSAVKLVVLVRATGFAIEPNYAVLLVPLTLPSSEAQFYLTPRDLGEQAIEVTILRETERVGYMCLTVTVVPQGIDSGRARAKLLEPTNNGDLLKLGETRAVILVDWMKDGRLSYCVIDPATGSSEPKPVGVSPISVDESRVEEWTSKQGEIIQDYLKVDYSTTRDVEDAISGISSIGHALFKQITPPGFASLAQAWSGGSTIAIESNEGWVPWELLTHSASGPVWGDHFQVVRVPRVPVGYDKTFSHIVSIGERAETCGEVRKIASIVGDGITRGAEEGAYSAKRTFGTAVGLVRDLVEGGFSEFVSEISDADIVHITCHGRGAPFYHLSLGPGAGRRLLVSQVETLVLKPGAVIFANACSSNRCELFLGEFQNFGWNFYLRGARPFIGTLGPVPSTHAIAFAQHFYRGFLVSGLSAGRALREARKVVAQTFNSPFHLFYCLYGSAAERRRIPGSTSDFFTKV